MYFLKQWIESVFYLWRSFDKPAGFAGTNNPIESFNNKIKKNFLHVVSSNFKE